MAWTLTHTALRAGTYSGLLTGVEPDAPHIEAVHNGETLEGLTVSGIDGITGQWQVSLTLPEEMMSDEVQSVTFRLADGTTLGNLAVYSSLSTHDDLRSEVDFLRAELEMLKTAFRRFAR